MKKGNFSDISTSTIFYAIYHCLLAISVKFGYESRNQQCTFALIYSLIEDNKIKFENGLLDKIASIEIKEGSDITSVEIREQYQYGTKLSIKDDLYKELFELAKKLYQLQKLY